MSFDSETIHEFLKQNLLFVGLFCIGLIFLGIGLIQLLTSKTAQREFPPIEQVQSSNTPSTMLTIDVEGAVIHPGVYSLSSGKRVQDALIAAGGLSQTADREYVSKNVNQALKLTDSMKIYIPTQGEQPVAGSDSSLISINTASVTDLDALPGVGPATAEKIISHRPYNSLEELVSKKAVSQTEFNKLKDQIQL